MKQDNKEAMPHLEALKYKPSLDERILDTDGESMNKILDDQRQMRGTGGSLG